MTGADLGLLVVLRYQDLSEMGKKFFVSLVWVVIQRSNESLWPSIGIKCCNGKETVARP